MFKGDKIKMSKELYIVHCVDTEGPLNESIYDTFDRIKNIFGIELSPDEATLKKLQKKEIDLGGKEEAVYQLVAPQRLNMNKTWTEIDGMIKRITSNEYRNAVLDSAGNGWYYNWFCMDHVGFLGVNPRHRDAGYHNIFDYYRRLCVLQNNDDVQFHFHPISISGDYNLSGTNYLFNSPLYDILAHKIIDRGWFPSAYRPGFHCERPDANWFLEQWIPFDYANQSCENSCNQPDLADGRWGDWRLATSQWESYHPNSRNYQIPGDYKRSIARCLNIEARLREINIDEVRKAFKRADSGKTTILAFCNHDFRNMEPEIDKIRDLICKVKMEFNNVKFYFSNAITAFRKELQINITPPDLNAELLVQDSNHAVLTVSASNCFGPQPFLAIKDKGKGYYYENFDFTLDKNKWTYTFDDNTIILDHVDTIGVACNSDSGVVEVIRIKASDGSQRKDRYNYE